MHALLGAKEQDELTGFSGIVTGRVEYITGCHQLLVQPPVDEKGAHRDAHWIDEIRCVSVSTDRFRLRQDVTDQPGFDKPAPIR